ncbi:MAG: hypothetical protein WB783_06550 [Arenicellales bacterium]
MWYDDASVLTDGGAHGAEIFIHHGEHLLGLERLRDAREALDVGEDHGGFPAHRAHDAAV